MIDILLTNDDGINSAGFYPLLKKLSKKYSVCAVVPSEQQSWAGKAISAHRSLSVTKIKLNEFEVYSIDGTPADCVQIGLYDLLKQKPRLAVAGINIGSNTGSGHVLSSGTVGAAMEAAVNNVPAIASSLFLTDKLYRHIDFFDSLSYKFFDQATLITAKIVDMALKSKLDDSLDILSLNVPYGATLSTEINVTVPHREPYGQLFKQQAGHFEHIDSALVRKNLAADTDLKTLYDSHVSITPLNLDLVSERSLEQLTKLLQ